MDSSQRPEECPCDINSFEIKYFLFSKRDILLNFVLDKNISETLYKARGEISGQ